MTSNLRVWTAWPAEGFASAIGTDVDSDVTFWLMKNQNRVPLANGWRCALLVWDRRRKKDKIPEVTGAFGYGGALCFSRALLPRLFPGPTPELEFLSARIDGDDLVLLNCLRVTNAIDRASSDLKMLEVEGSPPSIFDVRWINIADRRALEWDVFCIPSSEDPSVPRRFLVTDVFVSRYRSLNLRGLDFKQVGYIVPDASQAVPKPPAPPAPPPKPSKRKPPKLTSAPLPADEQVELAEVCAEWRQRLQLAPDSSPETILQRLTEETQRLRPTFWTMSAEDRIDASLGLSAIYGELLCKAHGWSWAELRQSRSKRWISVVSPSRAHALALLPYVQQQMQSEGSTLTLLFNMIAAGSLPESEPGQLVVVA